MVYVSWGMGGHKDERPGRQKTPIKNSISFALLQKSH